nr:hypothetical protein [uncultured Campylobacter sp.]
MKSRLFIGFSLILILAGASPRALRLQSRSRRPKQSQIADICGTGAIWRLVFRYLLLKLYFISGARFLQRGSLASKTPQIKFAAAKHKIQI